MANMLGLRLSILDKLIAAFGEGNTVPFLARYRKEMTGGLDEKVLFDVQSSILAMEELIKRKEYILSKLKEDGVNEEKIFAKITACYDKQQLEDLYSPYKKKRKTKASLARDNGLEPLAKIIMGQYALSLKQEVNRFVKGNVKSFEEAVSGAQDIIVEWVSDDLLTKEKLRDSFRKYGVIYSKKTNLEHQDAHKYKDYYDFSERIIKCPSHRFLALLRGQKQKILRMKIMIDNEGSISRLEQKYVRSASESGDLVKEAISKAFTKYIAPSIENQIVKEYKVKADIEAINVFQKNLENLLLAAPLKGLNVLALDPGFRSGCKVVCVDEMGQLLEHSIIYPHPPQNSREAAAEIILKLVKRHEVKAICIGNGTASRETKSFIESIKPAYVEAYVISESGASIYSASEVAREEFPKLDLTVRGAISLARRLQDPLSELVKLDPKSIGVGQYQHDVDSTKLKNSLDQTVLSCVNKVGINLNTASPYILSYIAGLGSTLAKNIVTHRAEHGKFSKLSQLKKVARLGAKAYEQSAGFLRLSDGDNPLDNTGIHPEAYPKLKSILKQESISLSAALSDPNLLEKINIGDYIDDQFGKESLQDIFIELARPGHDPRGKAAVFAFDESIKNIEDLKEGMVLPGIVSNVTNFGAFIDIGIKENGLLHISQITNKFIKSASEILSVEQKLMVKIIAIDMNRSRISLSLKDGGKILS